MWIKFESKESFGDKEQELYELIQNSDGNDSVVIYVQDPKAIKRLPPNRNVLANVELLEKLKEKFGENCVKLVEKNVENVR